MCNRKTKQGIDLNKMQKAGEKKERRSKKAKVKLPRFVRVVCYSQRRRRINDEQSQQHEAEEQEIKVRTHRTEGEGELQVGFALKRRTGNSTKDEREVRNERPGGRSRSQGPI
jgi:hypothetical protein